MKLLARLFVVLACLPVARCARGQVSEIPWQQFGRDAAHTNRTPYIGVSSPQLLWSASVTGSDSPVVALDGTLFLTRGDMQSFYTYIYKVSPNGEASVFCGNSFMSPARVPALSSDSSRLYSVENGSGVYCLDTSDGHVVWSQQGSFEPYSSSSPTVGTNGSVYVGGYSGWYGASALVAITQAGTVSWYWNPGLTYCSAPAIAANGTLFVGGNSSFGGLLAAFRPSGEQVWNRQLPGRCGSPMVTSSGDLLTVQSGYGLTAVNAADGTDRWRFTGATSGTEPALGQDGTVYWVGEGTLFAINGQTGSERWRFSLGTTSGTRPTVDGANRIYLADSDGRLRVIGNNGQEIWRSDQHVAYTQPVIGPDGTIYTVGPEGMSAFGAPSPHGFALKKALVLTDVNATASGGFADVYGFPFHTMDPLRGVSDPPWVQRGAFGNTIETAQAHAQLDPGDTSVVGLKAHGQWSRLGQVIDPSIGYVVDELNPAGSNTWRTRDLTATSVSTFQFSSQDAQKRFDTFSIDLSYDWQGIGMAKEHGVAELIQASPDICELADLAFAGKSLPQATVKAAALLFDLYHDQVQLYGAGIEMLPDKSRFAGWTNVILSFHKPDGSVLGALDPLGAGLYGQELESTQINWSRTAHSQASILLPVGEPVNACLTMTTHAAALGGAESYFGITGYRITISGPEGTDPLVISGTDPSGAPSINFYLGASLIQAVHTVPFVVGSVEAQDTFGPIQPLESPQVVVIRATTDEPVAGVIVPFELVPGMTQLNAHWDAMWPDTSALDGVTLSFGLVLLNESGNGVVIGDLLNSLLVEGISLEGVPGMSWHSGMQDLVLDLAGIPEGEYALFLAYGCADGVNAESYLVISGLSATLVPEPAALSLLALGGLGLIHRRRK